MTDVTLILSIVSTCLAVFWFIWNIIKQYLKNNNDIVRSKKEEINEVIDNRYNEDELKAELLNTYASIWSTPKYTNYILSNIDMDNLYDESILKKWFRKSKLKLDALLLLMKKQIKWYWEPLDLTEIIKKEKNSLIEQMWNDIDNIMENNYEWIKQMFKCSDEDLILWRKAFSRVKDFWLRKIDDLFNWIIDKICIQKD